MQQLGEMSEKMSEKHSCRHWDQRRRRGLLSSHTWTEIPLQSMEKNTVKQSTCSPWRSMTQRIFTCSPWKTAQQSKWLCSEKKLQLIESPHWSSALVKTATYRKHHLQEWAGNIDHRGAHTVLVCPWSTLPQGKHSHWRSSQRPKSFEWNQMLALRKSVRKKEQ